MIRVFLDANILFSAAWSEGTGIGKLWERKGIQLVTSPYALMEAVRNIQLKKPVAAPRLSALASKVEVSALTAPLTNAHGLPKKDFPILEAAIGSGCTALLTGDMTHFGHLIGTEVEGTRILTVSMFLTSDTGSSS
jgi:predicted nucleic acid-binding protein